MSSSSESEDLFGASSDSGEDTDELVAASSSSKKTPPIATKKKTQAKGKGGGGGGNATGRSGTKKKLGTSRLSKKTSAKSHKDENNDDEDDSDDDEARGLFDSDDDDDDDDDNKEEKEDNVQNKEETRALSKRERMEALKNKARKAAGLQDKPKSKQSSKSRKARTDEKEDEEKEKGYDSGDSYDSGVEYQRTKEDDDFIDVEGDDEDAIKEYYKEQHFDDERPDGHDEGEISSGARKGSSSKKRGRGGDGLSEADKKDQDNPIMAAVNRMKKKKKVVRTFEDLKIAAEDFVSKMEYAADEDDLAIKEKRPGLKKLQMLPEALDIMTNREMIRPLLESDLLSAVKRWIQPLPDGSLGNVTVRQSMIDVISKMGTGEDHGIDTDDLKKSGFGKLVMVLYNHKQETPAIKKQLRKLIEEWSRTIFGKSGNMRDLASVQSVRVRKQGLTTYSHASMNVKEVEEAAAESLSRGMPSSDDGDIGAVLSKGVKQARDLGRNRVRIPVSKGFQYTVRPSDVTGDVADKKTRISSVADKRESLHKRMLEKSRPVSKNARSANISIEGRPTKG